MDCGERFQHPLIERYAGREMAELFSPRSRHGVWRELWIALARAQMELGLEIAEEQLIEMAKAHGPVHGIREISPEMMADLTAAIKDE